MNKDVFDLERELKRRIINQEEEFSLVFESNNMHLRYLLSFYRETALELKSLGCSREQISSLTSLAGRSGALFIEKESPFRY